MVASIEYIERIIENYSKATQVNLQSSCRQGNLVNITSELATDVMITGDLHGHRRNFNLIRKIADLEKNPKRHLVLQEVCHGGPTYPTNGGCMSHAVLEDIAKLITQFPDRVHFIMGNHELAELADYPIQKNKQLLNMLFRLGLQQMYGPATDKVREAYFPFLRSCPLAVRLSDGIFICHSFPENVDRRRWNPSLFHHEIEPTEYYQRNELFELLWGRDYRQENADAFAKMVGAEVIVNGHEPCPNGFNTPNDRQVTLDCCSDKACYVILPTDQPLTQPEIVKRIQKLA